MDGEVQIQNPNTEVRKKSKIRSPKVSTTAGGLREQRSFSDFGFPLCALLLLLGVHAARAADDSDGVSLLKRHWFEARTTHFHAYSCGTTQAVARVAGRLEQFRQAYSALAGGSQAVASPPIVVMAYPTHADMEPFMQLYQGHAANMSAFFIHGSDENLIVLPLTGAGSLESIFHEYTHLLLRHNDRVWPLWLEEGMAEIYSTFEVTGPHTIRIGAPIRRHLRLLSERACIPLRDLFAVTHDSPGYNESEHQGIFYAQSWLLAHYLMLGDNPARKARFGQLTAFLRRGQSPEGAFTNAFLASLPVIENELRDYLNRGKFEPCTMSAMNADLTAPQPMATHGVGSAEVAFRLGDQLLRVGRLEEAEHYFDKAQVLAPKSPLSYEGRGLLAAKQGQSSEAVRFLGEALQRGSTSFLAHYLFAREKYQLSTDTPGRHTRIEGELAGEIRKNLEQAVALMPDFGPAHELLGFFEMVQRDNLVAAEQHLGRAIELEPDNHAYRFSMAQALVLKGETEPARRILEGLSLPYIEPQLRAEAEGLIQKINELKKN